jgi:hypothetical protein
MPVDRSALVDFVAEIGRFYVKDKALRRAQEAMAASLAEGVVPTNAQVSAYLAAVKRYFAGFAREAREHMKDVDRRLAKVSQQQFNLSAELGVAARRVEVTQGVLARVEELARL